MQMRGKSSRLGLAFLSADRAGLANMSLLGGIEEFPEFRFDWFSNSSIFALRFATDFVSSWMVRCCISTSTRRSSRDSDSSPDTKQNSATCGRGIQKPGGPPPSPPSTVVSMVVVESPEPMLWTAKRDGQRAGWLRALARPDQRCFLHPRDCDRDAYNLLIGAALRTVQHDVHIEVDEGDTDAQGDLRARGFVVNRVEDHYVLPTDPATTRLAESTMPAGFAILSAAHADLDRWRELDDTLRQDVPGTAGWRNDPETFVEQTLDDPEFDPATYLLAVEQPSGQYVGLVRVWITTSGPRLGLIGTLSSHRRRGLGRALIAEAFGVLHHRGQTSATCEVDQSNNASQRLMTSMGARHDGTTVELVRRHKQP